MLVLIGAVVSAVALMTLVNHSFAQNESAAPAAGAAAAPGQYKIGIVELQTVMDAYKKQEAEVAKLKSETDKVDADLKAKVEAWQKKQKDFTDKRDTLDQNVARSTEESLHKEYVELQSQTRLAEEQLERRKNLLKRDLLQDIIKTVESIGVRENYHLIMESDPNTRTGVLYFASGLNITQKVVEQLNAQYKP